MPGRTRRPPDSDPRPRPSHSWTLAVFSCCRHTCTYTHVHTHRHTRAWEAFIYDEPFRDFRPEALEKLASLKTTCRASDQTSIGDALGEAVCSQQITEPHLRMYINLTTHSFKESEC